MKKVIIISGSVVAVGLLVYFVVYPSIMRSNIRKRLDEAFKDPASANAVGGLDKFQLSGVFDAHSYNAQTSKATISLIQARERAAQIWENYSSWMGSNQTAIVSAFNGLKHVDDVTKIAHEFYGSYEEDLLGVLKSALKDKAQYNLLIGKIDKLAKN